MKKLSENMSDLSCGIFFGLLLILGVGSVIKKTFMSPVVDVFPRKHGTEEKVILSQFINECQITYADDETILCKNNTRIEKKLVTGKDYSMWVTAHKYEIILSQGGPLSGTLLVSQRCPKYTPDECSMGEAFKSLTEGAPEAIEKDLIASRELAGY